MPEPDDLQEHVEQRLALEHEDRSFEVKNPLHLSDKAHCAKVARAAAVGTLRDGGPVCVGVARIRRPWVRTEPAQDEGNT